jgi:hypothetical protein
MFLNFFDDDRPISLIVKIVLTLVFIGVSYLAYEFYPDILHMKRTAVVNSHQYIEASRSRLSKLASEYRAADTDIKRYQVAEGDYKELIDGFIAQKIAIKEQIRVEAVKIAADEIPSEVIKILEEEE